MAEAKRGNGRVDFVSFFRASAPSFVVMAKAKKESSDGDRTALNSSDQAVVVKPCDGDATAKIEWL